MKQLFRDTVWEHFPERMNLPIEWAPGQGKLTHFGQHQKHSSKVIGLEQSDKKKDCRFSGIKKSVWPQISTRQSSIPKDNTIKSARYLKKENMGEAFYSLSHSSYGI